MEGGGRRGADAEAADVSLLLSAEAGSRLRRLSNQPADFLLRIVPRASVDWLVDHQVRAFYLPMAAMLTLFGGLDGILHLFSVYVTAAGMALWVLLVLWLRSSLLLNAARVENGRLLEEERRLEHTYTARELRRHRRLLQNIMDHHGGPFRELLTIRYTVGAVAADDRGERVHSTWADHPLLWREFDIQSTGHASSLLHSFRDAKAAAKDLTTGDPLELYDVAAVGTSVRLLVLFARPVGRNPRQWSVTWHWPGMFDDLRKDHEDRIEIQIPQQNWEQLTVELTFPTTAVGPAFRNHPNVGQTRQERRPDGTMLSWTVKNPKPARYGLRFGVEHFLPP